MDKIKPEVIPYMSLGVDVIGQSLKIINFYQDAVHDFKLEILGWQRSRSRIMECLKKNLPLGQDIFDDLEDYHKQINWYVANMGKERQQENPLDYID